MEFQFDISVEIVMSFRFVSQENANASRMILLYSNIKSNRGKKILTNFSCVHTKRAFHFCLSYRLILFTIYTTVFGCNDESLCLRVNKIASKLNKGSRVQCLFSVIPSNC